MTLWLPKFFFHNQLIVLYFGSSNCRLQCHDRQMLYHDGYEENKNSMMLLRSTYLLMEYVHISNLCKLLHIFTTSVKGSIAEGRSLF